MCCVLTCREHRAVPILEHMVMKIEFALRAQSVQQEVVDTLVGTVGFPGRTRRAAQGVSTRGAAVSEACCTSSKWHQTCIQAWRPRMPRAAAG